MQLLLKALRVNWKLHCVHRPQNSGQVKYMNRVLKGTLTKLTLETYSDWVTLLLFSLIEFEIHPIPWD